MSFLSPIPFLLLYCQKKPNLDQIKLYFFTSLLLRIAYLGLTMSLRTISFIICIPGFFLLRRQLRKEERNAIHGALANGGTELEALRKDEFVISNSDQSQQTADNSTDRETRLWRIQLNWPPHPFSSPSQTSQVNKCNHTHSSEICRESHFIRSSHIKHQFYICTTGPVKALWIWQNILYNWSISWMYMLLFFLFSI